jgi:hypothetical protein
MVTITKTLAINTVSCKKLILGRGRKGSGTFLGVLSAASVMAGLSVLSWAAAGAGTHHPYGFPPSLHGDDVT